MDSVYRGWVNGWEGVGWALDVSGKPKASCTIKWNRNRVIVSSVKHRNSHSVHTCQAKTVVSSSLIPHAALLVLPTPWTVMNLPG